MTKQYVKMAIWLPFVILALSPHVDAAELAKINTPERPVLCWYMTCFFNSVDFYKQEIELAQRHGIDGFIVDCGAWMETDAKTGELKATSYVAAAERMYEAARQLGTGFKLLMGPEYSVIPWGPNIEDMVRRFHNHPNQFRWNGKDVLCGYGPEENQYHPILEKLRKEGIEVCLVPHIFLPKYQYLPTYETIEDLFRDAPMLDGYTNFDAKELNSIIASNAISRRVTQRLGKIYCAGVIPAYNSANLQDYHGMQGYGAMWRGLINDGADWVGIVIGNDYNEDSGLMPFRWPGGQDKSYFDRDESFLDVTSYYSSWFKSGQQPAINQDKIFITYRDRSKWLRKAWDDKLDKWVDIGLTTRYPFDQIHDDVKDNVYLDTFLIAPAVLSVSIGMTSSTIEMPAGVGHAEVPLIPGVPTATLRRTVNGKLKTIVEVTGRKLIIAQATRENSVIGYHRIPRTWSSGTAVGDIRRIEAESGSLDGGAKLIKLGSAVTVQNQLSVGSGFTVPVSGLETGTYNIRIIYSNPAKSDARLTLFADGSSRLEKDSYYIPAFLPPTGNSKFATVSFFWSLYDNTKSLTMQWRAGQDPKLASADNDYGSVFVDAIELVRVEPYVASSTSGSALPQMAAIPGGQFIMGSKEGEPDETPLHKATLSPFAIGKYEITNAEFERFDPAHRTMRNGNSWRDREPVVAVSWVDAASYCNWLSKQAELTPAYTETSADSRQWALEPAADGFRLPTEAEWEYVATGRGEGRKYPWGKDTPVSEKHGHFTGAKSLDILPVLPSSEAGGVVVVGSYPAGSSRDGVMDLAGNVAEWCSDWYGPYVAADQTNPICTTPGNYRVIRGGSWGWYNFSQRCAEREFNNPGYPGHSYYGFRVVIPAAGWKKIQLIK